MSTGTSLKSTAQTSRNRQVVFALLIVIVFGAMWPYTEWLQRRKDSADLGEASIGQIDGGSFLLKLAMIMGFRGVVADVLWNDSIELQKQQEWDKLKEKVDFITKLQPHFLSVWTFQGWNLAYNVAAEWDDPADKYTWIKNGINFLRKGVDKNWRSPDLIWDTAWTYFNKIGMADEAIILRRLFFDDRDLDGQNFKIDPNTHEPRDDNFLLAKGWFTKAVRLVDEGVQRIDSRVEGKVQYVDKMPDRKGRPGDLDFRVKPAQAQIRYAIGLEKMSVKDLPPTFGDVARSAWDLAYLDLKDFGEYEFPAHNNPAEKIQIDRITDPARYNSPELSDNQRFWINRWAEQQNYPYWKDKADAEREMAGVLARQDFYEGTLALKEARFRDAVAKYQEGLNRWQDLLERHPIYLRDDLNKKDTGEVVRRYVFALKQVGETPGDDLPFKDLYEAVKNEPFRDPFDQLDMMKSKAQAQPTSPVGARAK
jgi:hypothetical protein